jgi:hypothetical protein
LLVRVGERASGPRLFRERGDERGRITGAPSVCAQNLPLNSTRGAFRVEECSELLGKGTSRHCRSMLEEDEEYAKRRVPF